MLITVTQLLIGFSVVSAAVLLAAYLFFLDDLEKTPIGRLACAVFLVALSALQLFHLDVLSTGADPVTTRAYGLWLLTAPPAFFFFSRAVLLPDRLLSPWHCLHGLPIVAGLFLPPAVVTPLAFAIGTGYTAWFARLVYGMRRNVSRFRFEMFFFGLFALTAAVILALVLAMPLFGTRTFYLVYANAISISFVLIVAALILFPALLSDISDVAQLTYAKSTLTDVDVDDALARLNRLMDEDRLYEDETLGLATVADAMSMSTHQLSELVNRHVGCGFSRYIRERRVEAARKLLLNEPRTSVLAIGMSIGFRSQSSFYAAFREVTGMSPGAWRKTAGKR